MPKAKKPKVSSDSDSSGPDDRNPPPTKKSKENPQNNSGEQEWTLEKLKKVRVSEFRGVKRVDIREFYEKNGEYLPGRKGISLTLTQWKKLIELSDEITAAMN